MLQVFIYKGYGACEKAGMVLYRTLLKYVCPKTYNVSFISPEEILSGVLNEETSLFAIGGGFDLGLIKVLGSTGMSKIKDYVLNGGSYLGICSGAYFACDYIEFDKGGPLEVVGERFLKFYPGHGYGPLYKMYDYNTRSGAVASLMNFLPEPKELTGTIPNVNGHEDSVKGLEPSDYEWSMNLFKKYDASRVFKVYFNGGGLFVGRDSNVSVSKGKVTEGGVRDMHHECKSDENVGGHKVDQNCESQKNGIYNVLSELEGDKNAHLGKNTESHRDVKHTESHVHGQSTKFLDNNYDTKSHGNEHSAESHVDYKLSDKTEQVKFEQQTQRSESLNDCFLDNNGQQMKDTNNEQMEHGFLPVMKGKHKTMNGINKDIFSNQKGLGYDTVTVLAKFDDLECRPAAIVKCKVGKGVAVLSGAHFEYDSADIDDGDELVKDIVPELKCSEMSRKCLTLSILKEMNIKTVE